MGWVTSPPLKHTPHRLKNGGRWRRFVEKEVKTNGRPQREGDSGEKGWS